MGEPLLNNFFNKFLFGSQIERLWIHGCDSCGISRVSLKFGYGVLSIASSVLESSR